MTNIASSLIIILFSMSLLLLGSTGSYAIATSDWLGSMVVISIILLGLYKTGQTKKIHFSPLLVSMFAFALLVLIAALFAPYFNPNAVWIVFGFLLGAGFLLALHQFNLNDKIINSILITLVVIGLIHALIGIFQFQGWHIPGVGIFNVRSAISGFYQVNSLSSFLATTTLIALVVKPNGYKYLSILLLVAIFLSAFAIELTRSRTGIFGLGIGMVLLITARYFHIQKFLLSVWTWLACVFLGYISAYLLFDFSIANKLTSLTDAEGLQRYSMWQASWQLFLEKPIFGHGLGGFGNAFQVAYVDVKNSLGQINIMSSYTTHPHNEILYRMSESGIFGMLGMLGMFIIIITTLIKQKIQGLVFFALLVPIALHSQTEYPFYQSLYHWTLFLFLLFIASKKSTLTFNIKQLKLTYLKPVLILIFLLSSAYLIDKVQKSADFTTAINQRNSTKWQSLNHLKQDEYYGDIVKRMALVDLSGKIPKMQKQQLKQVLSDIEQHYKHWKSSVYYNLKALTLMRLNQVELAYQSIQTALKLYPGYTQKQNVELAIVHKAAYFVMATPKKITHHQDWIKRFIDKMNNTDDSLLTKNNYDLMIFVLLKTNQTKLAEKWQLKKRTKYK